jgi:dTDP-4-dehydrorhamnose reductase
MYGTATSRKGWTFPELMLNKARAGEVLRVVDDQVLSPTYTADLSRRVKELIEHGMEGLFHVTNAGECSWYEFARGVLELAGVDAKIEPIDSVKTQRRAQRPSYSALTSVRLQAFGLSPLRSWRDALCNYLQAKGVV